MLTYHDIIKLQYPAKTPVRYLDNTYAGIIWNPLDVNPNPTQNDLDTAIALADQQLVHIEMGVNFADPAQAVLLINDFKIGGNLIVESIRSVADMSFDDGTVQSTAAIQSVYNSNHATLAIGYSGNIRTLTVDTDAVSTNIPSTLVSRDGAGDIAVGNIIATNLSTTSSTKIGRAHV